MAVRHALVLLLMLAPLLVTATFSVEPTDAVFERDHHSSDELSHDIFEWGPESYDDGINRLTDEVRLGFIGHKMPTCHAGACDVSSEIWRELSFRRRYISYDVALKKNRVPCNLPGKSYYNCQRGRQVNPYRRRCSFITKCARIMN